MSIRKIHHAAPSLDTTIIGIHDEDSSLALFRGIPFANVRKRWTHSRVNGDLSSPFDATTYGPRCPQTDGDSLVIEVNEGDPEIGMDEFKCLNLNVATPTAALDGTDLLPVMVWIHGGAFNHGQNSFARQQPQRLCKLATENGTPFVMVQIQYRLGPLGFSASKDLAWELEQEQQSGADAYLGNYGFVDQINAFKWVQKYIADFGGDPNNVTACGISAGSACIHDHILTGEPLFDKAIMMSGAAPMLGPLPRPLYEMVWAGLSKAFDVTDLSSEEKLEKLRAVEPMELLKKHPPAVLGPIADGSLLPSSWSFFDKVENTTRCKRIMLGDARVEAIIWDKLLKQVTPAGFHELVLSKFSPEGVKQFYHNFDFLTENGEPTSEKFFFSLRDFMSIMMFQYPNMKIAATFPESYLYHFEEVSPYPGPTLGVPYHAQCSLYLYQSQVDKDIHGEGARKTMREMGKLWAGFLHGRKPWSEYKEGEKFMRFGPDGYGDLKDAKTDELRNYKYLEDDWLTTHFTQAKDVVMGLLLGAAAAAAA